MENVMTKGFAELSAAEMNEVVGGVDPWGTAVAIVTLFGAVAVGSWNAGRAFVRDIRNKFFN